MGTDTASDLLNDSARLAAIVESSADAIVSKDLNGVITSWNQGAEALFGYTADEAIGQPVTMLMPPDRVDEEPGILARIRNGERIQSYETVRRRKDGTLIDISLTVSPVYNSEGKIVGASKIARDITHSKRTEAELTKLASIVETSNDPIISKDLNGIIRSWNKGAEMTFGYTADEAIGQSVTMLMPPDRVDEEPGILARIRRGEKIDHYETVRRHKDGHLLEISLNVSPVYDSHGVIVGASKIVRDITEHKRIDKAVRERETARAILDAQESERARIARDLHDHLGQQMTALRLRLETLLARCDDDRTRSEIEELRRAALKIDREIGFLAWEMRPTELDVLGLEGALMSFIQEWSGQYDIEVEFHSNIEPSASKNKALPEGVDLNLYRILQESLNNIMKHARAHKVDVLVQRRAGEISLVVEDDGVGFEAGNGSSEVSGGLGLSGMRERAALLGGSLEIESRKGNGTTVLVRMPIEDPAVEKDNVETFRPRSAGRRQFGQGYRS